jgi:NAD(P)-dependent dehydrogenase (short-subunit alcohol dehydrogenase family)
MHYFNTRDKEQKMKLEKKTAVITGAGKGIGKAVSQRFAAEGARVIVSDIDDAAGSAAVDEITGKGGAAKYFHCDVLNLDEIKKLMDFAISNFGQIDLLVNNAGGAIVAGKMLPFCETGYDAIDRMLDINLMGTVYCSRAVVEHMIERRSGKIINMSSVSGLFGGTPIMYGTAKGAIVSFTKGLASELAQFGITVNCLSPWAIATREGPANLPTRLGRTATADEAANLILFLASAEADFITGSNYVIDGGFCCGTGRI